MKRDELERDLGRFFSELAEKHGEPHDEPPGPKPRPDDDPLVHELVRSFLMWEAPRSGVGAAHSRLRESVVDYNELRICFCDEAASVLGARYPLARDRCLRLRSVLREVFLRENGLTLAHLRDENKRTARAYLDSLPGMTPFVAARLCLLELHAHAFPLDSRLLAVLESGGVMEEGLDPETASTKLERAIRADEAPYCYRLLETEAENEKPAPRRSKTGEAKPRGGKSGNAKSTSKRAGRS